MCVCVNVSAPASGTVNTSGSVSSRVSDTSNSGFFQSFISKSTPVWVGLMAIGVTGAASLLYQHYQYQQEKKKKPEKKKTERVTHTSTWTCRFRIPLKSGNPELELNQQLVSLISYQSFDPMQLDLNLNSHALTGSRSNVDLFCGVDYFFV